MPCLGSTVSKSTVTSSKPWLKPNGEKPRKRGYREWNGGRVTRPKGRAYTACAESPLKGAKEALETHFPMGFFRTRFSRAVFNIPGS